MFQKRRKRLPGDVVVEMHGNLGNWLDRLCGCCNPADPLEGTFPDAFPTAFSNHISVPEFSAWIHALNHAIEPDVQRCKKAKKCAGGFVLASLILVFALIGIFLMMFACVPMFMVLGRYQRVAASIRSFLNGPETRALLAHGISVELDDSDPTGSLALLFKMSPVVAVVQPVVVQQQQHIAIQVQQPAGMYYQPPPAFAPGYAPQGYQQPSQGYVGLQPPPPQQQQFQQGYHPGQQDYYQQGSGYAYPPASAPEAGK